jgi:hypothetical protein
MLSRTHLEQLEDEAYDAGLSSGQSHGIYCLTYSPSEMWDPPSVPIRYEQFAYSYNSGYADGIQVSIDEDDDPTSE